MNRTIKTVATIIGIALLCVIFVFLAMGSESTQLSIESRFCLGTYCTLTVYGPRTKAQNAMAEVWTELSNLENNISANLDHSDVSRINAAAGDGSWVQVSEQTYKLVEFAVETGRRTEGALDISMGRLIDLWGIGTAEAKVPSVEETNALLKGCSLDDVLLSKKDDAFLIKSTKPGTHIHLGAVGKGYAADMAARILKKHGIENAVLDLGGNVYCLGGHPTMFGVNAFKIGIQDPTGDRGSVFLSLSVKDLSVVTSGSYERSVTGPDGHVYSHILDPGTGRSIENNVRSVTVVGESSLVCDALSTALFVLGPQKAKEIMVRSYPDYLAVFLVEVDGALSVVRVGNEGVLL